MHRARPLAFLTSLALALSLSGQTLPRSTPPEGPPTAQVSNARSLFSEDPLADSREELMELLSPKAGSGAAPFTSSRVPESKPATPYLLPYSSVGRVLVFWPDGSIGNCSGTVIAPRVLLTAGHCLHRGSDGDAGYALGLVFEPGYFQGGSWGRWISARLLASPAWLKGGGKLPNSGDYALALMKDNNNVRLGDFVGTFNVALRHLFPNHVTMLGYPDAFDGAERMHVVTSQSFKRGPKKIVLYPGDMGPGADGGPWIEDFGVPAAEQGDPASFNRVVGVTSFSVPGPGGTQFVGSSILDDDLGSLFRTLCLEDISNCSS